MRVILLFLWVCKGFFAVSKEEALDNIVTRAHCKNKLSLLRNSRLLLHNYYICPDKYPWKYKQMCCKYSLDKIIEESAVGEWMRKNGEFKYMY